MKKELRAHLAWIARPASRRTLKAQLARLDGDHGQQRSQDALASALHDYAELAERNVKDLVPLGLQPVLIERARTLAGALREHSCRPASHDRQDAVKLRNCLLALLAERVAEIRLAARFLYRDNPRLLLRATSVYERKRKAKWKRASAAAKRAAAG